MKRILGSLYVQVLIGLFGGIAVGFLFPQTADYLKPLGDLFIRGIKMIIGPIVLCTVVVGIAQVGSGKAVGRIGGKAILYFEVVTTIAMLIGLAAGNFIRPGAGINADPASLDPTKVAQYAKGGPPTESSIVDFFLNLVPGNVVESFVRGDLVQILVFAILLGLALSSMGAKAERLVQSIDTLGHGLLRVIGFVMHLAPLAAFGSMAFTVGKYGIDVLGQLTLLILCLYGSCALFILAILWPICRFWGGISMWKLLRYFREEIFITLGTASSEAVLPRMLEKLEKLGADKAVVGLVIPAGYSFNLAGSSLYMPLATLFIAQALNIDLPLETQITMMAILLFTSKGIAGVAGASMIVLAATLQSTEVLPVAGLALVLGIDRLQNEVRSLTNLIGNAIATVVMAKSENAFDLERARAVLDGRIDVEARLESGEELAHPHPLPVAQEAGPA